MIKTMTKNIQPGSYSAAPVYSKSGQMILPARTLLTAQQISRLNYYGIEWVDIEEASDSAPSAEQDAPLSYAQRVRGSQEYQTFKEGYDQTSRYLETSFDDLVNKNIPLESRDLLEQVSVLYADCLTSLSVFDLLHNMRHVDDTTFAHSINVALIARMLGKWLELPEEDLDTLTLAGLLHDIGKCAIDVNILLNPLTIGPKERDELQKHAAIGAELLSGQNLDQRIIDAALMHHERCDGSGYPAGLTDSEISDFAKIIAIADVYDSMTARRPYRQGCCPYEVIANFEQEGLERYDIKYIITFMTRILDTYIGNTVKLNNGETGTVIMNSTTFYSRPLLALSNGEYMDLVKHPKLYIEALI